MRLSLILASLALSACATPLERVISVAGDVPDWFVDARAEVRGEGYPALSGVPNNIEDPLTEGQVQQAAAVLDVYADFLDHPRAAVSTTSPEEIEAYRESLISEFPEEATLKPMTPLSEAEIEAIRAVFRPYEFFDVDPEG